MNIQTLYEKPRGCGYRKKGGFYFAGEPEGTPCGLLPIELTVCPCCGTGFKFSRGWSWVGKEIFKDAVCVAPECKIRCAPFDGSVDKFGMIWIGEKYYPTIDTFNAEARHMGISRRIKTIPRDFKVGESWIFFAHIHAIRKDGGEFAPGLFKAWRPQRIEYVIKGDETPEELAKLEARGVSLVDIIPLEQEED